MLDILEGINWFYLGASWVLNFFELSLLYLVVSSLLDQQLKFTIGRTLFAIIYALTMGTLVFFVGGFIYQAMVLIVMFCSVKWLTKGVADIRNNADIMLLVVISYLTGLTLNVITSVLVGFVGLSEVWSMLVAYVFSLTIFLLLRHKVDFNKFFILVIDRALFKLLFFVLLITLVVAFAIVSFDALAFFEYIFVFFILGIIGAVSLAYVIRLTYLYTDTLPDRYHDVDELLSILKNKAYQATNIEQLQHDIDVIIDLIGIKVEKPNLQRISINQFESTILASIETLKLNTIHRAEVVTNIRYQAVHEIIDDVRIAYFLGILLKNAMQTLTKKPIFVDIFSSKSLVKIIVSNEMPEKTEKELRRMLQKGYSTKGKAGRGYGLTKLKKLVDQYQGEINISQEHQSDEDTNFVKIAITL